MNDITLMPEPRGGWLMMCSCGTSEIRPSAMDTWHEFAVTAVEDRTYQLVCSQCHQRSLYHQPTPAAEDDR
ncbi:hypothetical protein [Halomonas getboli]|uniref:hypothetical protein n=1 Tax=Halomonas getboli TaxID=2935862 RepID=UPI001FFFC091|nr:hypothetical protein [Halomonas getboli]MCK2183222.1 hypothetical protein [Halomonas getboli]